MDDDEAGERILPEEERRLVWLFIAHAARLTNRLCVGEKTSAVTAWPHQLHTSVRILTGWPCRLLICDEVGLGSLVPFLFQASEQRGRFGGESASRGIQASRS